MRQFFSGAGAGAVSGSVPGIGPEGNANDAAVALAGTPVEGAGVAGRACAQTNSGVVWTNTPINRAKYLGAIFTFLTLAYASYL